MPRLDEEFERRWQQEAEAVMSGMREWRLQHPKAMFREIELALASRAADSQDEVGRVLPGWREMSEAVALELAEWRRTHPKATLTEIEDAVLEAMQQLQAQALGEVVRASASADLAAHPATERARCPTCGGQLEPRGRQRRRVRPARQRVPLDLDRSYAVCATCGAGLFPPR